jgi:hypothetical protein
LATHLFDFFHELPGKLSNRCEIAGLCAHREIARHSHGNRAAVDPGGDILQADAPVSISSEAMRLALVSFFRQDYRNHTGGKNLT